MCVKRSKHCTNLIPLFLTPRQGKTSKIIQYNTKFTYKAISGIS